MVNLLGEIAEGRDQLRKRVAVEHRSWSSLGGKRLSGSPL
jgi:hypothetical protein